MGKQQNLLIFLKFWDKLYHMDKQKIIEKKVFAYIEEQRLICRGDKVIVGVSGGADSVCLLFVLLEYAKDRDIRLAVVHVHHGIRPEAGQDAAYVEKLCKERDIPFYLTRGDVKALAQQQKCSEEEAGRNLRYQAFEEAAVDCGADRIAVAHTANDRAETFLFHLFRGSDVRGLGSIRPIRGQIIRPLLILERCEIEDYLRERGIPYCQDATNAGDDYTRNRIRHHILPYVEQEIVSNPVAHLARTAHVLDETESYLQSQTTEALRQCVEAFEESLSSGIIMIQVSSFLGLHPFLQKRVLYSLISSRAGGARDITHVHVEDTLRLFTGMGNPRISLPGGLVAERSYEKVILRKDKEKAAGPRLDSYEAIFRTGSCEEILGCSAREYLQQIAAPETQEVLQNKYTKGFDDDTIKKSMPILRTRRTGDYLTLKGEKGELIHKSLKDYMITEKIPRARRDEIPVLATGSHVLWLVGFRMSEEGKLHANTKQVLQVQLIKKTEDKNG